MKEITVYVLGIISLVGNFFQTHAYLKRDVLNLRTAMNELNRKGEKPKYLNTKFWFKTEDDIPTIRQKLANMMLNNINDTVDPCDDFYQFACGNWLENNPLPKDKYMFDNYEIILDEVNRLLKNRLEQPVSDNEPMAYTKVKNHYKSCMNNETIDSIGSKPLLTFLDSLGGWPLISKNWNGSNFDWISLASQLAKYQNEILIFYDVIPNLKNSSEHILLIEKPSLFLKDTSMYLSPSKVKSLEAYKRYIVEVATLLGAQEYEVTKAVEDVVQFEINLANITEPAENNRVMTLEDIEMKFPDLKRFISNVFNLSQNSNVELNNLHYFKELEKLMKTTKTSTLANYMLWKMIVNMLYFMGDRFKKADGNFINNAYGVESLPARWEQCVVQMSKDLGLAVGAMFVQKHFDEFYKKEVILMNKYIQRAFGETIANISWLDKETKDLTKEKINSILFSIGYEDFILEQQKIDDYYKDIDIRLEYFFENKMNILKDRMRKIKSKIGLPVNKSLSVLNIPTGLIANFNYRLNSIVLAAVMFQPPAFHKYFPKSINYGGIGVVIGHEMIHSFDSNGRRYDKYGNLNPQWPDEAVKTFTEKTRCFVEQYEQNFVTKKDTQNNGELKLGENIADNGGVKQAFLAYQMWLQAQQDFNETLPGMNYTSGQLFFLSFAQQYCSVFRPAVGEIVLNQDSHSPNNFRVIGTLSNSDDFAKEFKCPIGSRMNPVKKCSLW
ncbi:neprilysin-4-like [Cimex lectularius]|uniref:Endothelin-converting enzyme n=1 Tax=Cimex lectularius TaxID=79782 RepID=A0A8I6R6E8_CIMLE|nr:neprilysin-4-like [Cimex lectularius]